MSVSAARAIFYTALTVWGVSELVAPVREWPVQPKRGGVPRRVNGRVVDGERVGVSAERWFGAPREGGRKHAGVDLLASPGDEIVAIEHGRVLGRLPGYVGLDAIAVEGSSGIVVYAEFDLDDGIDENTLLVTGQRIGRARPSKQGTQLHVELWDHLHAPTGFTPWIGTRPAGLLDPTEMLLGI